MIDVDREHLLTPAEAAATVPAWKRWRGQVRPFHPETIRRWMSEGLRGVRLEGVQVGGSMLTSREALQRFYAALAEMKGRS